MSTPQEVRPNLPDTMTWEELEKLPKEIAGEIELWDGRVVRAHRGPVEHQTYTNRLWGALDYWAQRASADDVLRHCYEVTTETNVFLQPGRKSDFLTPDFMVYRCLGSEYEYIWADKALLVGEVLSPTNTPHDVEAKKARYASAGILFYWEVTLAREPRGVAVVRAYGLESVAGQLPEGVTPLHPANYLLIDEWMPESCAGIESIIPFPMNIPWDMLKF